MSEIKPTTEQLAIITATAQPESMMIRAYAGTAKTTSLKLASRQIREPALALAFNRKITAELTSAMPSNILVKSLNGLGHQALQRTINTKLQLDDRKLGKLLTQLNRDRKLELTHDEWDSIRQLVVKAMQAGITPEDRGTPLLPNTRSSWQTLWDDLGLPGNGVFDRCHEVAQELLQISVNEALAGRISYDDQIYIPTLIQGIFTKFPLIIADEFQDFSPLNHHLMLKACAADAKLILAGDPLQSIYAFRGADAQSMDSARRYAPSWHDLRLTLTFRCPKVIVERQQTHAPGFRAYETNQLGMFKRLVFIEEETTQERGWNINTVIPSISDSTIAILCRNNAPLLSLAFKLLRRGVGVQMLGRVIGRNLVTLSRKIIPEDTDNATTCASKICAWEEREISLARANDKPDRIDSITDRAECLRAVLADANVQDAGQLRQALEKLFSRDSGIVTLSTIHRAKGLEWDIIVHLDPWRLPSKFAIASGNPTALQQEANLRYVCETRTKHTLIEADLRDFR